MTAPTLTLNIHTMPGLETIPVTREGYDGRSRVSVLPTSDPAIGLRVSTYYGNRKTYETHVLGMRHMTGGSYMTSPLHGKTVRTSEPQARFNAKKLDQAHLTGLGAVIVALTEDPDVFAGVLAHTPIRD